MPARQGFRSRDLSAYLFTALRDTWHNGARLSLREHRSSTSFCPSTTTTLEVEASPMEVLQPSVNEPAILRYSRIYSGGIDVYLSDIGLILHGKDFSAWYRTATKC
jgi:hypothetical protein